MRLEQSLFGAAFQNPVVLAAGTCGFGREVAGVVDLESLGGIVTKSVTLEPREGNPPPRVTEFGPGMLNSIGLANPGAERAAREKLPWLARNLRRARVFVSVAGHAPGEYVRVVEALDSRDGFLGYELNLSCPNDARLEGLPFALDRDALAGLIRDVRARTDRPVLAKLAPNDPDPGATARAAEEAGADGLTLVNTLPGLVLEPGSGRPVLGAGSGGVSGPALRPLGVWAVERARRRCSLPIVGAGGVSTAEDAVQYLRAGASLVQVGTASFADPRAALGIVAGLEAWGRRRGIGSVAELVGAGPGRRDAPDAPRGPAAGVVTVGE